mgnify:CR=1 FL=1
MGETKSNCVCATGSYAYFTSSNGLYIVNISNPANPQSEGSVSGTSNLNLENLDLQGNALAVCSHSNGTLLYDISDPANPVEVTGHNYTGESSNGEMRIKGDYLTAIAATFTGNVSLYYFGKAG